MHHRTCSPEELAPDRLFKNQLLHIVEVSVFVLDGSSVLLSAIPVHLLAGYWTLQGVVSTGTLVPRYFLTQQVCMQAQDLLF